MSPTGALPRRWPSAWPSLWPEVRDRSAFGLTAALVTALGLTWLGVPGLTWWLPLLPALLLIGPLSWPGRVRRGFDRAGDEGTLRVVDERDQVLVWGPRGGVAAEVAPDGAIRYRPRGAVTRGSTPNV
ncbi:hypothetical protein BH20ACT5_BH20ACT5_01570 [soil metagenome]